MTYSHLRADCLYTGISSGPNFKLLLTPCSAPHQPLCFHSILAPSVMYTELDARLRLFRCRWNDAVLQFARHVQLVPVRDLSEPQPHLPCVHIHLLDGQLQLGRRFNGVARCRCALSARCCHNRPTLLITFPVDSARMTQTWRQCRRLDRLLQALPVNY